MPKTIALAVLIDADQFDCDAVVFALMDEPLTGQRAVVMVGGREFAGEVRGVKVEGACVVGKVYGAQVCTKIIEATTMSVCGRAATTWVRVSRPDTVEDYAVCDEHVPAAAASNEGGS